MRSLVALLVMATPALAFACASCARDASPWAAAFIAAMIGAPYAIGFLAVRAIREGDGEAPAGGDR